MSTSDKEMYFEFQNLASSDPSSPAIAVVTGGAGFIGSHTVDILLELGWEVRVIDLFGKVEFAKNLAHLVGNPKFHYFSADIRLIEEDFSAFQESTVVFHFAGLGDIVPSIENPQEYVETNVLGTVRVLEASRKAGVRRFVYAASSSCYGDNPPLPTDEEAPIRCMYPYALSKNLGEQACFHWMEVYGLSVNSIRIFNAYGLRARTSGTYGAVLGVFLKQKLENRPLTVVGDGSQERDFVYVTDVARAFILAGISDLEGKIWNVGTGSPNSINRLAELLDQPVVHLADRPGEPATTHANISRIQSELGWEPQVDFERGVEKVLSRIQDWQEAPLWDEHSISGATKLWFDVLSRDGKEG